MAKYDATKFYWLQLKEDFFDEDAIDWLEEQPNGKEYSLFYLKLCLKSLRTNGVLIRRVGNMLVPYDHIKLGELTKTNPDTVMVAMNLLLKIGLVQKLDNGELYMTQVENMIGSQSKSAFKKQQQRLNKTLLIGSGQKVDKCPPDIEIDIEQEKELEEEKLKENNTLINNKNNNIKEKENIIKEKENIIEIINYLNSKTHKQYRHTTSKTQTLIKARFKEGFNIDDFKKVIDIKTNQWMGTEWEQYLRPETLFGTKFENYLNQNGTIKNRPDWYSDYLDEVKNEKNRRNKNNKNLSQDDMNKIFNDFENI